MKCYLCQSLAKHLALRYFNLQFMELMTERQLYFDLWMPPQFHPCASTRLKWHPFRADCSASALSTHSSIVCLALILVQSKGSINRECTHPRCTRTVNIFLSSARCKLALTCTVLWAPPISEDFWWWVCAFQERPSANCTNTKGARKHVTGHWLSKNIEWHYFGCTCWKSSLPPAHRYWAMYGEEKKYITISSRPCK